MEKRFLRFIGGVLLFCGVAWVLICALVVFSVPLAAPYLMLAVPGVPLFVLGAWLWRRAGAVRGKQPANPPAIRPLREHTRRKTPVSAPTPPQRRKPQQSEEAERRQLLEQAKALAADDPALLVRLERALDAFPHKILEPICRGSVPAYVRDPDVQVDKIRQNLYQFEDCFVVPADVDLAAALDAWLDIRATAHLSPEITRYFRQYGYHGGRPRFLLRDAAQPDRSTGGRQALLQRCKEYEVMLMLDLKGGCYRDLVSGKYYKLGIGVTYPGMADDAATYGELRWSDTEAPTPTSGNDRGKD